MTLDHCLWAMLVAGGPSIDRLSEWGTLAGNFVCVVGASHCDRLNQLDLSHFDQQENMLAITTHPHFLLWSSTAYLVTKGDYESFNAVKGEIFAFFFASLKAKYQGQVHPV